MMTLCACKCRLYAQFDAASHKEGYVGYVSFPFLRKPVYREIFVLFQISSFAVYQIIFNHTEPILRGEIFLSQNGAISNGVEPLSVTGLAL